MGSIISVGFAAYCYAGSIDFWFASIPSSVRSFEHMQHASFLLVIRRGGCNL